MKIKVNAQRILFVITMIALNEPLALYTSIFHQLFSLGKWIALLYASYLFIKNIKSFNSVIYLIIVYYLFMLYPTIIEGGDQRVWFRIFYMFISTVIIVHVHMIKEGRFVINTMFTLITVILFINLLYLGIYGTDIVEGTYGGSGVTYFIGIRTRIGEWAYIGIMYGMLYLYYEKKKINIRFIILLSSIIIFIILNRVTTAIFMLILFMVLKTLADKGLIKLNKLLTFSFVFIFVVNVLLIFFHFQNYFSWLLVDIMGEDLTLNSRTSIWESVVIQLLQSPYIGHGVGHVAQFEFRKLTYSSIYATATHNQFLNIVYETGMIGFGIFMVYMIKLIRKFEHLKLDKAFNIIGVTFIIILTSMTVEISGNNVLYFSLLMVMLNKNRLTKELIDDRKYG